MTRGTSTKPVERIIARRILPAEPILVWTLERPGMRVMPSVSVKGNASKSVTAGWRILVYFVNFGIADWVESNRCIPLEQLATTSFDSVILKRSGKRNRFELVKQRNSLRGACISAVKLITGVSMSNKSWLWIERPIGILVNRPSKANPLRIKEDDHQEICGNYPIFSSLLDGRGGKCKAGRLVKSPLHK